MLTIRLQRVGRKNQPVFRIVLAEKHRAAQKKVVQVLGTYNPRNKEFAVREERVKYWLEKRVPLSPTVHNLFVTKKLIEGKKVQAWRPRKKAESAAAPKADSPTPSPPAQLRLDEVPGGRAEQGEGVKAETPTAA